MFSLDRMGSQKVWAANDPKRDPGTFGESLLQVINPMSLPWQLTEKINGICCLQAVLTDHLSKLSI